MLKVLIDWLTFTVDTSNRDKIIKDILKKNENDFEKLESGKMGYRERVVHQKIEVLSGGSKGMGIHTILTGEACRFYENDDDLTNLIARINFNKGRVRRIDLAMDFINLNYDLMDKITEHLNAALVTSRWRDNIRIEKRNISDNEITGRTINFGSRKSEIFMRVYDKKMQIETEYNNYIRLELEIKGDKAEILQKQILEKDIGEIITSLLNNYIRFINQGTCKNKSRWETAKWWEDILNNTKKMKLSKEAKERTVEELKHYLISQTSANFATIIMAEKGNLDFFDELLKEGERKMKNKHYEIAGRYKNEIL